MIYGLYLSATGVLANSHRQDVIANNLANTETVGFKRDMPVFQQQLTEAQRRRLSPNLHSNPLLERLGGGLAVAPSVVDTSPGDPEKTGNELDLAIQGSGYFAVQDRGRTVLTRDGRFLLDRHGNLALAGGGQPVLDDKGIPIKLEASWPISIGPDGAITQKGQPAGRVGLFDVPDRSKLKKQGNLLLAYPDAKQLRPADNSTLRSQFVERSNAEPTRELAALLDAQRQLEANANMIRYQDQTLSRLVNDVGKIG